ncbi:MULTISPECIES: Rap1a/Tai family immunity protein [unclassified Paraburkholderia]|uniref:Rap1a/Tai family immunity protein n=1 Tax=unclassified Paraburkholderia TaxID=2615204 RepID=UPI002AB31A4B|nr:MULTISPECIES: Rap1a/Tai family immunity protein [unclassified Paraburkholderia]
MKKRIYASAALAIALATGSTFAQTQPAPSIDQGDGFYAICQRAENLEACAMYLAGYSNGVLVQTLIDRQKPRYCLPQNLTRGDQLRVVLGYIKGHLDQILEPTGAIVYKALLANFPCR